jgi:hypothetical protein
LLMSGPRINILKRIGAGLLVKSAYKVRYAK